VPILYASFYGVKRIEKDENRTEIAS